MYWRHFDLSAEPFSLTPDPAFLYLSSVHAEAYAALMVGLRERRGLIAMIGEVGTGKTTLVYSLLSALGPEIHTAYISNARLSFDGILRSALRDFSVECDSVHSAELLEAFNQFLNQCAEDGSTAAIVIDEAQNLSRDTFEDLRLLTNFETYKHKLLQIVLVGQPELDSKLRDPSLRQVADRIAVRCHVNPLTAHEVRQYLQHRLSAAGGSIEIFSEGAVRMLVHYSRGIPRSINILGHNAMLFAYGSGRTRVTRKDVRSAVREREGRGLVRFEARLPQWLSRGGERAPRARLSYAQMLLAGVAAGLVFFALGASGAKLLREASSHDAQPPATELHAPVRTLDAKDTRGKRPHDGSRVHEGSAVVNNGSTADVTKPAPVAVEQSAPVVVSPPVNDVGPTPAASEPTTASADENHPTATDKAPEKAPEPAADAAATATHDVVASAEPALPMPEPSPVVAPAPQPAPAAPVAPEASAPAAPAAPAPIVASAPAAPAAAKRQTQENAGGTAKVVITSKPTDGRAAADIRVIQVSPGSSLYDLMTNIYGAYDPRYVPRIQAMNPQMKDPNFIVAGDELRFPEDLREETRKQSR
jgi:type II secretory pathway predicted ATPase ExeA